MSELPVTRRAIDLPERLTDERLRELSEMPFSGLYAHGYDCKRAIYELQRLRAQTRLREVALEKALDWYRCTVATGDRTALEKDGGQIAAVALTSDGREGSR